MQILAGSQLHVCGIFPQAQAGQLPWLAQLCLPIMNLPLSLLVPPAIDMHSLSQVRAAEPQALKDEAEAAKRQAAEDAAAAKRAKEYAARAEVARSRPARDEMATRPAAPRRQPSPELERYRPRAASEVRGAHIMPCCGRVRCITQS